MKPSRKRRFALRHLVLPILAFSMLMGSGAFAQTDENPAIDKLVADNSDFAFRLYGALQAEEADNMFFSPYSISQALAMAYAGANGETAAQMADVLGFTLPPETLHPAFNELNTELMEYGNTLPDYYVEQGADLPRLQIANAFWGEQTFPFRQDYIDQMEAIYGAGLQLTDFINAPEDARLMINQWAADQTEDRIQDILPEGIVTPNTRLALANGIYFKHFWMEEFNEDLTQDAWFTLLDGSTVTVPTMYGVKNTTYFAGDGYSGIELSYMEYSYSMIILMPDEGHFEEFEDGLTFERYSEIVNNPSFAFVNLYMPRFGFDYAVSLSDTLKAMGMTDAFDVSADFTKMADVTPGTADGLWLSTVLHKTFISVDEHGTEAAAVTVVLGAGGGGPPEEVTLRLDHPFIFLIQDRRTHTILFIGRVMNPAG